MTIQSLYEQGRALLLTAGVPDPGHDAFLLLEEVSGVSHADFLASPDRIADDETASAYLSLCERRAERIPLQHLTGRQVFMGIELAVRPGVLIPRWDTEVLVESVLSRINEHRENIGAKNCQILDLGCGSGCILISLVSALKQEGPVRGIGVDLSQEALALADENARANGVSREISWRMSDWYDSVPERDFSVIVSNPPYIARDVIDTLEPEVADHEPRRALDGGEDGLDAYRTIVSSAPDHLADRGLLAVEIGSDQGAAVAELFAANGFRDAAVIQDLAGLDRVVIGEKNPADKSAD